MESLIVSLTVAAIGGLTALAYRHPEAYGRIYVPLVVIVVGTQAVLGAWDIALGRAYLEASEHLTAETRPKVSAAINGLKMLTDWRGVLPLAASAYLTFLYMLPVILRPRAE